VDRRRLPGSDEDVGPLAGSFFGPALETAHPDGRYLVLQAVGEIRKKKTSRELKGRTLHEMPTLASAAAL
jgi:hypothetical protein